MSSKNNMQSYKKTIELQKNKSKKRFSNIVKKINSTFLISENKNGVKLLVLPHKLYLIKSLIKEFRR